MCADIVNSKIPFHAFVNLNAQQILRTFKLNSNTDARDLSFVDCSLITTQELYKEATVLTYDKQLIKFIKSL
jgi:hypothetical protein